jgi:hypothetical protein
VAENGQYLGDAIELVIYASSLLIPMGERNAASAMMVNMTAMVRKVHLNIHKMPKKMCRFFPENTSMC